MKKLMIAAASAAMIGGAFADGQVYEMTLNVKTTEAKSGTVYVQEGCYSSQSYRKQASVKIAGLFWGCDCETIGAPAEELSENSGYFFWNASKKAAFYDQEEEKYIQPAFTWDVLNRIGQKAADCEGVWDLTYGDAVLRGAGFGKVTGYEGSAYIKSMSGNFAGTTNPAQACKRCEEQAADAWPLCECGDNDDVLSAAYGTWTLKFNSSAAKKFANTEAGDWSWYKFPGDVLVAIKELMGEVEKTCESEAAVLAKAKAALAAAEEKLEQAQADKAAVTDEALKAAVTNLQAQQATILTGNDAWLAISNMYFKADTKAIFDRTTNGGFAMGTTGTGAGTTYDWDATLAANNTRYGVTGGATNAVRVAARAQAEAYGAVNSNEYYISYRVIIGGGTPVVQYGSKALAAYVADQYAKVSGTPSISITAASIAPAQGDDATTPRSYNDTFTVEAKNKVNAWAEDDAAWLLKKDGELEKATDAYGAAIQAMKAIFNSDVQIENDLTDANANWGARKSLQATAELAVREAEQDVDDAEASVETAQKAYDKCAE